MNGAIDMNNKVAAAGFDLIAVLQHFFGHALAVDVGAVGALQVLENALAAIAAHGEMHSRELEILVEHEAGFIRATNPHRRAVAQRLLVASMRTGGDFEYNFHADVRVPGPRRESSPRRDSERRRRLWSLVYASGRLRGRRPFGSDFPPGAADATM